MQNPTPCTPASSSFSWRINPSSHHVEYSFIDSIWLDAGLPTDPHGVFSRVWNKSFESTPLTWRTLPSTNTLVDPPSTHDSFDKKSWLAAHDEKRELYLLALVGAACGLRLSAQHWRLLSPNAVLHPQFGPGVTVATNGVEVLLFSFPRFGTEFMLVHRTNILGPVTSTAIATDSWDYVSNRACGSGCRRQKENPAAKPTPISKALDLLRSLQLLSSAPQP